MVDRSKIYVGEKNFIPEVTAGEHFAKDIELVEITLREEVVYDVDLTVPQKVELALALDELGIPILQLHSQGAAEVIRACRDAGVKARFEVLCRPYHPYGFDDFKAEIRNGVKAGADIIHPSITTPRKWIMGESVMTTGGIRERAIDAVKCAFDEGVKAVTLGYTDVPRTDIGHMVDIGRAAVELGASTILLNDTVGLAKPALFQYMVRQLKDGTGARIRVHCHDDFGLATANTIASFMAGAGGAELCVNGADPARSGIAPVDEVVMALLCLYDVDLGLKTETLTRIGNLFAKLTGIGLDDQKPVVADRNWMYKRDHIMRTITIDESIQFPYSPGLVGQKFQIGLGRGTGKVGVTAKLKALGLHVGDNGVSELVHKVTQAAISRKRRLSDDEFAKLVEEVQGSEK